MNLNLSRTQKSFIIGMDPSVDPAEAVQLLAKMGYEVLDRLCVHRSVLGAPQTGSYAPLLP